MSKIQTLKRAAKLSFKHPKYLASSLKVFLKCGTQGLKKSLHSTILQNDAHLYEESLDPGSKKGAIKISVVCPVYKPDIEFLKKAIESVQRQTYANWELCLVDDGSGDLNVSEFLTDIQNEQIKVLIKKQNEGISNATNEAASIASGDYLVFLDNDDVLSPIALEKIFKKILATDADILYTDQNGIDEHDGKISSLFKPDWSPDLFYSQMYLGHALAVKKVLFDEVGGLRTDYDGAQDYDLLLRLLLKNPRIEHVPLDLYSWRSIPTSTSSSPDAKPYAHDAGKKALQAYFDTKNPGAHIKVDDSPYPFVYDVRYPLPQNSLASIIIPTKDHADDLKTLIESIYEHTPQELFEILLLDNNSENAATKETFDSLKREHNNIKILPAPYQFNWSKINNQGIKQARGDVFVFLNNDVEVLQDGWLERLMENALRDEVGVVGNLLLYPDGTIQHAGVVIGLGGWADHIFQGMKPEHYGNPFVSPMVRRNVTAVTGASMAFSRKTFEKIGGFDESFIVCGSDVEICLRALSYGLRNLYLPEVRLIHSESKTRDPEDIPSVDFEKSKEAYQEMIAAGDPFFNPNLDYFSKAPRVISEREKLEQLVAKDYEVSIPEIKPLQFSRSKNTATRINLVLPSLHKKDIFGGIATALSCFNLLRKELNCDARIVVLNDIDPKEIRRDFPDFKIVKPDAGSREPLQIVSLPDNSMKSLSFRENDWFIATLWNSAYKLQEAFEDFSLKESIPAEKIKPLIYLIQDFEPGFYAWSTNYLLAEATYRSKHPVIALFNSGELYKNMKNAGYSFYKEFVFEPFLNPALQSYLLKLDGETSKKKQLLFYGRPSTERNAFSLGVEALRNWIEHSPHANEWRFLSAGEYHEPISLGKGRFLISQGKLNLEEYASLLSETSIGLSLMVSPHPSYPPLEMAAFGVNVVTNSYANKDLFLFSENVDSVSIPTPRNLASAIEKAANKYKPVSQVGIIKEAYPNYLKVDKPFPFIDDLKRLILKESS